MITLMTLLIDITQMLFYFVFVLYAFLFAIKHVFRRKGNKKGIRQIELIELKLKGIWKYVWSLFLTLVTMVICSLLAIGMVPIIYELNSPLGMGYAKFASYMIAICLWMMIGHRCYSSKPSAEIEK